MDGVDGKQRQAHAVPTRFVFDEQNINLSTNEAKKCRHASCNPSLV